MQAKQMVMLYLAQYIQFLAKRLFSNIAKIHMDKMEFRNGVETSATQRISLRPCVLYV